ENCRKFTGYCSLITGQEGIDHIGPHWFKRDLLFYRGTGFDWRLANDCHRYGNHRSLPGASETNPVDFMRLEEETPKMAGTEEHSYIKKAYLQAWPRISTRDNREQLQQVARARLDPGTAGLRNDQQSRCFLSAALIVTVVPIFQKDGMPGTVLHSGIPKHNTMKERSRLGWILSPMAKASAWCLCSLSDQMSHILAVKCTHKRDSFILALI
ncbi:unnamed protein product, partial [Porites evermanni]